jgi:Helix-turn-helix domain
MRSHRPSDRRIKSLRNYTIADVARILQVSRRTVRVWIKKGLPIIDRQRPFLIHGSDLKEFLFSRKQRRKSKCGPGEIFCVKCRVPKRPAGGMADYEPRSVMRGSLVGICPTCNTIISRWTSPAKLEHAKGNLEVKVTTAQSRLTDISEVTVDCHFEPVGDQDEI